MENKIQKIKVLFIILIVMFGLVQRVGATSINDSTTVNLQSISSCGNGQCETSLGENSTNCPGDCGCNSNGICEASRGEDSNNCSIDCLIARQGGGGLLLPTIFNLSIAKITLNSIEISWKTAISATCQVVWGTSAEHKDEVISERTFQTSHHTGITGLLPGTVYYFKVICSDQSGNQAQSQDQRFVTLLPIDFTPPANVSNLELQLKDNEAILQWINPPDADFKGVVIVRSTVFYPDSPWQKKQVYDGHENFFIDKNLEVGVTYYYTVFSYDQSGNYSSGSIISTAPKEVVVPPPITVGVPEKIRSLTLSDFEFSKEGIQIIPENNVVKAGPKQVITVLTDKVKLPSGFKAILDAQANTSFLGLNEVKSTYESTITFQKSGDYPFFIVIISEATKKPVKVLSGIFNLKIKIVDEESLFSRAFLFSLYSVLFLLILFIIFLLLRYPNYVKIKLGKR